MNQEEIDAYVYLADGKILSDPSYSRDPKKGEEDLKARVTKAWKHRKHFPSWVGNYIKRWSEEKARKTLSQIPTGESNPLMQLGSSDTEGDIKF